LSWKNIVYKTGKFKNRTLKLNTKSEIKKKKKMLKYWNLKIWKKFNINTSCQRSTNNVILRKSYKILNFFIKYQNQLKDKTIIWYTWEKI